MKRLAVVAVALSFGCVELAVGTVRTSISEGLTGFTDRALDRYTSALITYERGHPDEAIAILEDAERLSPSAPEIPFRRGLMLLEVHRDAEALSPLRRAVDLAPHVPRYRDPLSLCLDRLGRHAEAVQMLKEPHT